MPSKLVDFKLDNGETIQVAEQAAEYLTEYLKCIRNITSLDTLILFGSSLETRYTPGKSDIDLLFLCKDDNVLIDEVVNEQYKDYYTFLEMGISTDTLYVTHEEFNTLSSKLKYELIAKGKIIYKKEWSKNGY